MRVTLMMFLLTGVCALSTQTTLAQQTPTDIFVETLAQNTPQYSPNEPELQVAAMIAKSTAMKARNTAVIDSVTALSNTRIERNEVLYTSPSSILELAKLVKLYVKSLYGQASPQFKQVSALEFTPPRTR